MTNNNDFDYWINRILEEDKKMLEELGSDFDEEGVSYWEKWGKKPIDKNTTDTIE